VSEREWDRPVRASIAPVVIVGVRDHRPDRGLFDDAVPRVRVGVRRAAVRLASVHDRASLVNVDVAGMEFPVARSHVGLAPFGGRGAPNGESNRRDGKRAAPNVVRRTPVSRWSGPALRRGWTNGRSTHPERHRCRPCIRWPPPRVRHTATNRMRTRTNGWHTTTNGPRTTTNARRGATKVWCSATTDRRCTTNHTGSGRPVRIVTGCLLNCAERSPDCNNRLFECNEPSLASNIRSAQSNDPSFMPNDRSLKSNDRSPEPNDRSLGYSARHMVCACSSGTRAAEKCRSRRDSLCAQHRCSSATSGGCGTRVHACTTPAGCWRITGTDMVALWRIGVRRAKNRMVRAPAALPRSGTAVGQPPNLLRRNAVGVGKNGQRCAPNAGWSAPNAHWCAPNPRWSATNARR
jgi:hypothetical protein